MSTERLTVRRDHEAPPGGWRYTVPETGVTVTGNFASECMGQALAHMRANGIGVPDDFDEIFEDAACRESGHGMPFCGPPRPKPVAQGMPFLTWHKLGRFIKAMQEIILKRQIVCRAEAERRVAICCGTKNGDGSFTDPCPLSIYIGGCGSCSGVAGLAKWAAGEEHRAKLDVDPERPHCGACGCIVSLKCIGTNAALDRIYHVMPKYSDRCWRLEGNRGAEIKRMT